MRILGIKQDTNTIGWAIVETEDKLKFDPIDKGVRVFPEGVKIEKGVESSIAAERTTYKGARVVKFHRKLRKIETLKILVKNNLCPYLSTDDLNNWRYKKLYPTNEDFRHWLLTDNEGDKEKRKSKINNPYYFRNLVASEKLDLTKQENRYALGRAFYHISQRRGFLSNRLETTKPNESGAILSGIKQLSIAKENKTLGQYFYDLYKKGEKIRGYYTHREDHYLEEFKIICQLQELSKEQKDALYRAIFFQRPLKSQKGLIGKCPFETNKPRCAVSHPIFEEYRMLCFINNIKIKSPTDEKMRFLNEEERSKTKSRFYLLRDYFDFEDIAKQLAPKKQYKYFKSKDRKADDWLFNYHMKTNVSGCPLSGRLLSIFGDNWQNILKENPDAIDINDVWNVLMTFDSDQKLNEFATNKLKLDAEQTKKFVSAQLKQGYASLSVKAIKKILPFLRQGLGYSHAIFLANIQEVIRTDIWNKDENKTIICNEVIEIIQTQNEEKQIVDVINSLIKENHKNNATWSKEAINIYKNDILSCIQENFGFNNYNDFSDEKKNRIEKKAFDILEKQMLLNMGRGEFAKVGRIDERILQFLTDNFGSVNENKLYHPSALETYKPIKKGVDGKYYLGSPMTSSVRNPMAMRSMHQLRKVINELIKNDLIDENTVINIEMARDLKNANERKALQNMQRNREKDKKKYFDEIKNFFASNRINAYPSENDIIKYQLWEEQKHKC
jgi:CRISPR-associated endonuclease Csn1